MLRQLPCFYFFFFNEPAPTEISPLSLPDALPICSAVSARLLLDPLASPLLDCGPQSNTKGAGAPRPSGGGLVAVARAGAKSEAGKRPALSRRSEEHTSELQSPCNLVCRLLLAKPKPSLFTLAITMAIYPFIYHRFNHVASPATASASVSSARPPTPKPAIS